MPPLKVVIGIDPGKNGGIAVLGLKLERVEYLKMPNVFDFAEFVKNWKSRILRVFIEKQQPFPKQGLVSTSKLMKHYGELIGVLIASRVNFEEVSPKRWQSIYLYPKGLSKVERKRKSIELVRQLFGVDTKHDGIAEALLIAEWGRRQIVGGGNVL